MKKIYVGCSLAHAPAEFIDGIMALKNELRKHHEIMDFVGLGDHDPRKVFEWDTNCVKTCDCFIADATYPSTGLGIEIGLAIEHKKSILAIAKKGAKVSSMVTGITAKKFSFMWYENALDVVEDIKKKIEAS